MRDLGIAMDIGRCPDMIVGMQHVFLTHAHLDHALGVPFYAHQRRLFRLPPGRLYVPAETADGFARLMKLHEELEETEYPMEIIGMAPGEERPIHRSLHVRAHRSTHRVPTNAWEIIERREGRDRSLLFYTGDTDRRILEQNEALFRSSVLMIECSFVGDDTRERAQKYAHMHLEDLFEFAERFENEMIVLTHFSLRDAPDAIHREVSLRCPEVLRDRIRLALPEPFTMLS